MYKSLLLFCLIVIAGFQSHADDFKVTACRFHSNQGRNGMLPVFAQSVIDFLVTETPRQISYYQAGFFRKSADDAKVPAPYTLLLTVSDKGNGLNIKVNHHGSVARIAANTYQFSNRFAEGTLNCFSKYEKYYFKLNDGRAFSVATGLDNGYGALYYTSDALNVGEMCVAGDIKAAYEALKSDRTFDYTESLKHTDSELTWQHIPCLERDNRSDEMSSACLRFAPTTTDRDDDVTPYQKTVKRCATSVR